jgi:hypothetical protein
MKNQLNHSNIKEVMQKHYFKPGNFTRTFSDETFCKYEITIQLSNEKFEVIMTRSERNAIRRSRFSNFIKSIGGLGYVKIY